MQAMSAIRAEGLTKHYHLYERPADRLIEIFVRKPRHRVFPALSDLSFDVAPGETIGLIGQNGAGKSTLLKLLCKVTEPSSGTLQTRGTIASILELGTGFHPEFSGRDNAALNAAILGLSPAQVREKLPAILEFSELGSFLEQPVKTYSSGMYMRLAFSVAVNVDPDILVIDEALAVGDGHFQKKCIDKIRDFQQRGKTIFFCSHALYYISTLCHRTIWLDGGRLRAFGPSIDVVHEYESFLLSRDAEVAAAEAKPEVPVSAGSPVNIRALRIENRNGEEADLFSTGDDVQIRMVVESLDRSLPIHLLLSVNRAADEMQCFAVATHRDGIEALSGRNLYDVTIRLRNVPLLRGDYAIVAFAGDESAMHVYDRRDIRPAFSVGGDRFEIGLIEVPHEWIVHEEALATAR
jgi:lipopolysaccharide transport system ATP-binding protein